MYLLFYLHYAQVPARLLCLYYKRINTHFEVTYIMSDIIESEPNAINQPTITSK